MIKKNPLVSFFRSEFSVGVLLIIATLLAILFSNSNNSPLYQSFFEQPLDLNLDAIGFYKKLTLRDWINDFLMAIFFFLVGLELKAEIINGELSSRKKIIMPIVCAVSGVILPTLIYTLINYQNLYNLRGFAVASATDIAFAYGLIALFGKTFSNSLKIFLVALAVIDDLIAIILIALFYSSNINLIYCLIALIVMFFLAILNKQKSVNIIYYLILGLILWLSILKTGFHATLSGVILAFFIPFKVKNKFFLKNIAHQISPMVNFAILPIFAFANSGVSLATFSIDQLKSSVTLGIILGLFLGKQLGIMLIAWLMIRFKFAKLPLGTSWLEFYGASLFAGIGFTMSLFISSLAFVDNHLVFDQAKIGILVGSLLSLIGGTLVALILKYR